MNPLKFSLPAALALAVSLQGCSKPVPPLFPEEQGRLEDLSTQIRAKIEECGGFPRPTRAFEPLKHTFGFRVPFHASDVSLQRRTSDCVGEAIQILHTQAVANDDPCLPYYVSDLSSVAVHCARSE